MVTTERKISTPKTKQGIDWNLEWPPLYMLHKGEAGEDLEKRAA